MIETITILLLLIIILYLYWVASGRKINIGSFLLILYILSIAFSFFSKVGNNKFSFEASFYFLILLMFYLTPVLKFNSNYQFTIKPINLQLFKIISYIFIFFGIATYVFFLHIVLRLFLSHESLMILRTNMVGGQVFYDINIIYYFITFFCQFYPIVLLFYFYSVTFTSNSKLFNWLLLFSSTGYIINVLASIGRDGFVLWTMSYLFTYILFRKFMTHSQKFGFKRLAYYLIGLFSIIFIPITFSRFLRGGDYSTVINSIIYYFGSEFGNFNDLYNTISHKYDSASRIFPILDLFSHKKDELTLLERHQFYLNIYKIDINIFSTFIGDFFLSIETKLLFILSGMYSIFLYLLFYDNRRVPFGKIILLVFFSQIPLHGLFYYKLSYSVSNIYMIFIIILSLLFYKRFVIRDKVSKD